MVDARPQSAIMRKNSILSSVTTQQPSAAWGKTYSSGIDKDGLPGGRGKMYSFLRKKIKIHKKTSSLIFASMKGG